VLEFKSSTEETQGTSRTRKIVHEEKVRAPEASQAGALDLEKEGAEVPQALRGSIEERSGGHSEAAEDTCRAMKKKHGERSVTSGGESGH